MKNLSGKVAIITGASRGIGSEIAKELARDGASIIGVFSKDELGAKKTKEYIDSIGGYCKLYKCDISKPSECKELIEAINDKFGRIDILVNNAAKSKIGLLIDTNDEEILELINTNLVGTIFLSKYVADKMISKGKGNIINISSIWGQVGASCEVVYSASKGGINLLTKSLAKEVGTMGIRVNAVAPGVINTDMNKFLSDDEKESLIDEIPLGRFGETNEIAKIVSFLCKEDSSYLNGQIITVDGAMI